MLNIFSTIFSFNRISTLNELWIIYKQLFILPIVLLILSPLCPEKLCPSSWCAPIILAKVLLCPKASAISTDVFATSAWCIPLVVKCDSEVA